ncbi:hypothetical protein OB13_15100 [Pontibacter sp. HJ8]
MSKLRLFTFLFAALLMTSLSGCSKDDDDNEPSQRDLLTAGQWTGVSIWAYGQDISRMFIDETGYDIKKNLVKYDKAGTYADRYERMTLSGTWEFTDNEQSILHDKGTEDEYTSRIIKLTSTELYLEQTIEFEEEEPVTLEIRFSR